MKKISLLIVALIASEVNYAQTTKWDFDLGHSNIQFSISHMVISEVTGNFKSYEGTVLSDKEDFSDAKINFTIKVNSIDTHNEKRDQHLVGTDFFDAEKYPEITFKSKSLTKVSENKYKLTGDFTMHGVTKTIELDVKYGGTIKDPWGNTKAGFKITGTINRYDFGLKWNSTLETGGLMLGEELELVCNIELTKQK